MLPSDFDKAVHPLGRVFTGLGALQLEIVHSGGILRLDPNTALLRAYEENLALAQPIAMSVLSEEPGYLYRSNEMQLAFTLAELYRFLRRDLTVAEFKFLFHTYGSFFEIHDDFYDEHTGKALQPLEPRFARPKKTAKAPPPPPFPKQR